MSGVGRGTASAWGSPGRRRRSQGTSSSPAGGREGGRGREGGGAGGHHCCPSYSSRKSSNTDLNQAQLTPNHAVPALSHGPTPPPEFRELEVLFTLPRPKRQPPGTFLTVQPQGFGLVPVLVVGGGRAGGGWWQWGRGWEEVVAGQGVAGGGRSSSHRLLGPHASCGRDRLHLLSALCLILGGISSCSPGEAPQVPRPDTEGPACGP